MKLCVFYLQNIIPTTMTPMMPIMIIIWKKKIKIFTIMVHLSWELYDKHTSFSHFPWSICSEVHSSSLTYESGEIPTVTVFAWTHLSLNTLFDALQWKSWWLDSDLNCVPYSIFINHLWALHYVLIGHMNTPWVYFSWQVCLMDPH